MSHGKCPCSVLFPQFPDDSILGFLSVFCRLSSVLAIGILHVAAAAVVPLPTYHPSFSPQHQAKSVSKRDGGEKSLIINPMQALQQRKRTNEQTNGSVSGRPFANLAIIMSMIYRQRLIRAFVRSFSTSLSRITTELTTPRPWPQTRVSDPPPLPEPPTHDSTIRW
jgi:hypothetical protein